MDAIPGANTRQVHELATDKTGVLEKARILDDRQPFFPTADLIHDGASIGDRRRGRPEVSNKRYFQRRMDLFSSTRDPLARLEHTSRSLDKLFPIRVGNVGACFLQGADATRNRVRGQRIVGVEILDKLSPGQSRAAV